MIIGVPKEIKNNENRVGMTPSGVTELVERGHTVYMQSTSGEGSGFTDEEYVSVGAKILQTIEEIYAIADMIVKVNSNCPSLINGYSDAIGSFTFTIMSAIA